MRILGLALVLVLLGVPVFADSFDARVFPAYSVNGLYVDVSGVSPTPSLAPITTAQYTVTFDPAGGDLDRGIVNGAKSAKYAVPVAGPGGTLWQGNYFSTGSNGDKIVLTFAQPQFIMTFLWGSVDTYNTVTFDNGDSYTGSEAALQAAIQANGNQGQFGSAYVLYTSTAGFSSVTFTSTQYAFEFADVRTSVPDGGLTLVLLGGCLVGLETLRRKMRG